MLLLGDFLTEGLTHAVLSLVILCYYKEFCSYDGKVWEKGKEAFCSLMVRSHSPVSWCPWVVIFTKCFSAPSPWMRPEGLRGLVLGIFLPPGWLGSDKIVSF